jgi:hypothetical protein
MYGCGAGEEAAVPPDPPPSSISGDNCYAAEYVVEDVEDNGGGLTFFYGEDDTFPLGVDEYLDVSVLDLLRRLRHTRFPSSAPQECG